MKTRGSMKLVLLGLLAVVSFAVVPAAIAQPGEFVNGVLQPLADGFPKRAINIIVIDDPGSRDDLYAKSLQAALKGVSPVNITVSDEPSAVGGTWYTVQEVPKREGGAEGYYPFVISSFGVTTDLIVDPGTKEIGAKLDQLNMIIGTEIIPNVMIQRKNAPWGPTFAGMVKYAKDNPEKLKYISYQVGSGGDIACESVLQTVGIKVRKVPQGTQQECAATVGAGEGDFTFITAAIALTNQQAGRVDVTLLNSPFVPKIWSKDPNVVSLEQAGYGKVIGGSILGLGVPSQVPQTHVDWLYKLFKVAATSDLHPTRAETVPGLVFDIVDGATRNAQHREILRIADPVVRAMGIHIDDIKKK